MRKRLARWEWSGFFFVGAAGTLLHFVYDWSGGDLLAALFGAVNESTWEHMKLFFLPYFAFTAAELFALRMQDFLAVKAAAGALGLAVIPVLFYTLTGCFGTLPAWLNVCIFFLAVGAAYLLSHRALLRGALRGSVWQLLGLVLLLLGAAAFVLFTFRPPHLTLFRDPLTGTYGIAKKFFLPNG